MSKFLIRPMMPEDLTEALKLSSDEGWNQTDKDWRLLLENSGNVCIVAMKDDIIAGTATAINYENRLAWIGMVLVNKSLRGMGAGRMLLENMISRLTHIECIKLDATPAGEPLYSKLGFMPEYKILRMRRGPEDYQTKMAGCQNVEFIDSASFRIILKSDHISFGADRSYLLNKLLSNFPSKALFINKNNSVDGYFFGRDGIRFNYIGPLIAGSEESARCLISKALESSGGFPVAADIPEDKAGLISWLESIGFTKQRHFIRMFLSGNPYPGMVKNQYLIAGPEFG